MDRPIPAFYCVYLLRSTVSKLAHVYVGSTPNPKRRLRQHNGEIQGGATKTSWDRNRPWEMAVMVTGFPSKIAALQFEWSWQNTYKTRHVDGQDREELHSKDKLPSSGKAPAATLRRRLKDLHTLLRANSFARWPLDVRFFSPEAYTHWQTKVVPSTSYQLPQYTSVAFVGGDSTGLGPEMDTSTTNVTGINAIDKHVHHCVTPYLSPVALFTRHCGAESPAPRQWHLPNLQLTAVLDDSSQRD
ncbi:hypothetical protein FH972_024484 [Carpinus fangiana]|uniref:Structure-specific endonuclease subunit SLX1 homolog n=1 Tax=Carpinus fangiana TaxID=176857 RepID=A0A5N6KY54_9ROSI|nr:hypothetical protein FH972_024484 [Carpinus fangiana]